MKVWIIERDHEPIRGWPWYPDTPKGAKEVRAVLNKYPTSQEHYYDAVLYERIEPGGKS